MGYKFLIAIGLLFGIVACQEQVSTEEQTAKKEKEQLKSEIDSLEQIFFDESAKEISPELAGDLLRNYLRFTDTYITDEKTAEYLFKAAGISRGVKLPVKAIKLYRRILDEHPDFEKRAECAFLIAFIYDADLFDKEKARQAYQRVIDEFPDSEWTIQAKTRMTTLDLSDEELIKLFEEQNRVQQ